MTFAVHGGILDGRRCAFSRVHGRWMRPWHDIWNEHKRRVPRASFQHHQARQQPRGAAGGLTVVNNGRAVLPLIPFDNKSTASRSTRVSRCARSSFRARTSAKSRATSSSPPTAPARSSPSVGNPCSRRTVPNSAASTSSPHPCRRSRRTSRTIRPRLRRRPADRSIRPRPRRRPRSRCAQGRRATCATPTCGPTHRSLLRTRGH